jgi:predicted aspartyl protease
MRYAVLAAASLLCASSCGHSHRNLSPLRPTPAQTNPPQSAPYRLPADYVPLQASVPIPAVGSGCPSATTPPNTGGANTYTIPAHIDRQGFYGSEIFVGVCVDGHGPFPFVVDTGASSSVIDVGLAARLGLVSETQAAGIHPCDHQEVMVTPQSMSVAGVRLDPQNVIVGGLSTPTFPLMGILGVNVLSSFRAVRIDYTSDTIALLGPQSLGVPASPSLGTVPAPFTTGTTSTVPFVPNTNTSPGFEEVPVQIGSLHTSLVLDTGAQGTGITSDVASEAGLPESATSSEAYAGLGCQVETHYFAVATWQVGDVSLVPQPLAAVTGFFVAGGSLGSGTLEHYTPIVIDYQDGDLLLGPYGPVLDSARRGS